ncbi:MAG TPA: hypothetical protein V6C76_05785 [Drouetiella sp.]
MKTEDFSPKAALTKDGQGEAFADIARNTWSGNDKMNAQKGTGEAGSGGNDSTVTPKTGGPEIRVNPGAIGHEGTNGNGEGESAAGKSGGAAGGGGEFGKAGDQKSPMHNGSSEGHPSSSKDSPLTKPAGSDASGAASPKDTPAPSGSDLSSKKLEVRADSPAGYKLPDMVLI